MSDTVEIPIERLGLGGMHGELVVVDVFQNETRSDEERLKDQSAREFVVRALLAKNPDSVGPIRATFQNDRGSSFLLVPDRVLHSKVQTGDGVFHFHKNASNELSAVEFRCSAINVAQARDKFSRVVLPYLDLLSFFGNCPIHVTQTVCEDLKNHLSSTDYIAPHQSVTTNPHETSVRDDLMPILALYREAKNNTSSYYKFLCYYKILEGMFARLRPALFAEARRVGRQLDAVREVIPDHAELHLWNPTIIGKPIKAYFESELTPRFRHAVAHFALTQAPPLNLSDYTANRTFQGVVLVAELSARTVIETHLKYAEQLAQ